MNKKDMFIREKLQQDKKISDRANKIFDNIKEEFKMENNEKKVIKMSLGTFIAVAASFVIVLFLGVGLYTNRLNGTGLTESIKTNKTETAQAFRYALKSNYLEDFDLRFLQLENDRKNKIYSPISIKYVLAMLNEGTEGESKEQISSLIGEYKSNKYINSENMSFANALFIRDSYKGTVKENFVNSLKNKYNANVEYDSFNSAEKMNSWISDKTLGLIDNMLDDSSISELNFTLVNALAIDMDWEEKFLIRNVEGTSYSHENYSWITPHNLLSNNFEGIDNEISGMGIIASINNYDIVNTLGEENIRKTVENEFRKYLNEEGHEWERSYYLEGKDIETAVKDYLDTYINEINSNYKRVDSNTEFYVYEDEEVKAFAKDLKEYDGTTLQYVAIMPEEDLDKYIDNITAEDVNEVINNLKDLKSENFKEGVITQIVGYIPKFKFDYDLDLIKDLNDMGVKDVFDASKANLKGITDEQAYIGQAMHKANIEFTQDGIKASAATLMGGMGAGGMFDYYYDVPVETIDLTFNNPYMFIIRDKETGEVWFAGTVYEPLSIEDETEKDEVISYSEFLRQNGIIETETTEETKENIDENQKENDLTNNFETSDSNQNIFLGDVNCDGEIDIKDVVYLRQYIEEMVNLSEEEKANADVNDDGIITQEDLNILRKYLVEEISELPYKKQEDNNSENYETIDKNQNRYFGDVDLDGEVTDWDEIYLTRYLNNWDGYHLSENAKLNADVNYDGTVDETDVHILQQYLVGTYNRLPAEVPGSVSGANAMPEMLKYRNEEYRANYYYRLAGLRNNNDGTYTATVDFYSPIFYSEEQYKKIVDNGWGEVEGNSYTFSSKNNEFNVGYGYIYNDNVAYSIEKQNLGYAFYRETGGVIRIIDDFSGSFEMTLSENTIINQTPNGGKYILKEYANTLTNDFITRNMITFEYSKQDGSIYLLRDAR